MTSTPPRVLGVHAAVSDQDWLTDRLAIRVLSHPRLGLPFGPLAVALNGFGEFPQSQAADLVGSGRGWRGNGQVDGTAWLRLVPADGDTRSPVNVRLQGVFDAGTRVSVVRSQGDPGEGLMSVSEEPYTLWAPQVTYLRVDGRCEIQEISVTYPEEDLVGDVADAIGLPFGRLDGPGGPMYLGHDEDGLVAIDRVRRGAPRRPGPHEMDADPGADPADAEGNRVQGLVHDASTGQTLGDELAELLSRPHQHRHDRTPISSLIRPRPGHTLPETKGTRRSLEGILASATDPGIARWLGLAATFDPPDARVLSVAVAGRWLLAPSMWATWLATQQDPATVESLLRAAGVEDQLADQFPDLVSVLLWTQTYVDLTVRPGPPRAPMLGGNPSGVWIARDGRDVVRLPVAYDGVVPLAQAGLVRTDGGGDAAVLPSSPGDGTRVRPLFVRDGTGVDLVVDPPRDDGQYVFAGWQADMFGRWSERSPDTVISSPPRPGLPVPEPHWRHDLSQGGPEGEAPHAQRVEVSVSVPLRRPGEPAVTQVRIELGDAADVQPPTPGGVTVSLAGPALMRAAEADVALVVRFDGDDGSSSASNDVPIHFVDPRPPLAPPRDPVLRFASPPDRGGLATYSVPLPDLPGVTGWRVFAATESRLVAASGTDGLVVPPAGSSRDERASRWLAQQARLQRSRFDCLTPTPVGSGDFQGTSSGTSTDILFVRPVPQRAGAEPPFETCPVVAIAVPRTGAPTMPELRLDNTTTPAELRVLPSAGVVDADRYRLRMTSSSVADPRTAVVVAEGTLSEAEAGLAMPALRAFARVWLIAEVRARPEAGIGPVPTRWSPATQPLEVHDIPGDAPIVTEPDVTRVAGNLQVTVDVPGIAQDPFPVPYTLRLYERVDPAPWVMVASGPVVGESGTLAALIKPGADYQVVLVDPLGRASDPRPVPLPPP